MRKLWSVLLFLLIAAVSTLVIWNAFADKGASNTNSVTSNMEKKGKGKTDESVIADQGVIADQSVDADQSVVADREEVAKGPSEESMEESGQPAEVEELREREEPEEGAVFSLLPSEKAEALEEAGKIEEAEKVTINLISISFDEVPVPDVVDMFSRISGANIIVAGNFTNLYVTANLKNVEWKSALNLVLGSVNLSMIEDASGIIMVVTAEMYQEKLKQIEETKPLVTRIFKPQYMNPVDLVEQIIKLKILSPRGTIITSQSRVQHLSNLKSSLLGTERIQNPSITTEIIVTDIKEYVEKVGNLVKQLDKREPQVFIEARIIDIVSSDSKKIGFDWEMLDSFGVSAGLRDLSWSWSDSHEVENIKDSKESQYDTRTYEDEINLLYDLEGNRFEQSTLDPDTGLATVVPTRGIKDTIGKGRDITSDYSDSVKDTLEETKTASAILTVSDASLFLSALKRTAEADMISHPLIIVGNRVEAKIHVGERYPTVITEKTVDNTGAASSRDSYSEKVEWNDLGLTLWVIPEIDRKADVVRLTVSPQMSTWVKDINTPQGSVYPVISTRHLSTRVNVPSRHTVVIGGLIDHIKGKTEKRVPILGDIPLLGLLFRHTEDITEKHNLIIMLTVTVLDEAAPLTGMEGVAMQAVERLEKVPLSPKEAVPPSSFVSTSVVEQATNATVTEAEETPATELKIDE